MTWSLGRQKSTIFMDGQTSKNESALIMSLIELRESILSYLRTVESRTDSSQPLFPLLVQQNAPRGPLKRLPAIEPAE